MARAKTRWGLRLGLAWALALVLSAAWAQTPVWTIPQPSTSAGGNASSTIIGPATTQFQQVFASTAANEPIKQRKGCTIQNNGTHVMYVTEGLGTAASTQAKAAQLVSSGGTYYCVWQGTVLIGEIDIAGTSGDAFYAVQW